VRATSLFDTQKFNINVFIYFQVYPCLILFHIIQSAPGGTVNIPNGFRDRVISLYSSKIVDKREIFGEVGTVYLVQYISENSTDNIIAL
jgi:hypothetical protein